MGQQENEILQQLLVFRHERDWVQFHSPRSLAISISVEAAELLEHFQWLKDDEPPSPEKNEGVSEEIADIYIYLLLMAHDLGIDLIPSVLKKIEANRQKYPIDKAQGTARKYKPF